MIPIANQQILEDYLRTSTFLIYRIDNHSERTILNGVQWVQRFQWFHHEIRFFRIGQVESTDIGRDKYPNSILNINIIVLKRQQRECRLGAGIARLSHHKVTHSRERETKKEGKEKE